MRKIILIVFILTLICAVSMVFVGCNKNSIQSAELLQSASDEKFEYYLNISKTGYIVRGIGTVSGADIEIPSTYNGLPVVGIADKAFENCTWLQSVIIGDNVENIGKNAFYSCTNIRNVTIGKNVKSIGNYAFNSDIVEVYNKSSLNIIAGASDNGRVAINAKNVYTQEGGSKLKIDKNGFVIYDNTTLIDYIGNSTDIIIPKGIKTIDRRSLSRITLTKVVISANVTKIYASAIKTDEKTEVIFENNSDWFFAYSEKEWQNNTGGYFIMNPENWLGSFLYKK